MPRNQVLPVDTSIEDANLEKHDGDADVLLIRTGLAFTSTTAS